jgi:hypothetical protein
VCICDLVFPLGLIALAYLFLVRSSEPIVRARPVSHSIVLKRSQGMCRRTVTVSDTDTTMLAARHNSQAFFPGNVELQIRHILHYDFVSN